MMLKTLLKLAVLPFALAFWILAWTANAIMTVLLLVMTLGLAFPFIKRGS